MPPAVDHPGAPPAATDDWPFLYIAGPSIPEAYVKGVGAALAVSLLLVLAVVRWTREDEPGEPESRRILLIGLATAFYLTAILLAYQHELRTAQAPLPAAS